MRTAPRGRRSPRSPRNGCSPGRRAFGNLARFEGEVVKADALAFGRQLDLVLAVAVIHDNIVRSRRVYCDVGSAGVVAEVFSGGFLRDRFSILRALDARGPAAFRLYDGDQLDRVITQR